VSDAWEVERLRAPASDLHHRWFGPDVTRRVVDLRPTRAALVLGSTQPESDADQAALDAGSVDLVRRRSGGGAVLLVPDRTVWIDVELPRADDLWHDDVGAAFHWLGRAWAAAVAELGVDASVHTGPIIETAWSRRVCFAGLGPGEVTVGGRKLVGMSQRRTRDGARFQCIVHREWEAAPLLALLAIDEDERAAAAAELAGAATGLDADADALAAALLRHLP
jgi:lipoate-protein ligase A